MALYHVGYDSAMFELVAHEGQVGGHQRLGGRGVGFSDRGVMGESLLQSNTECDSPQNSHVISPSWK